MTAAAGDAGSAATGEPATAFDHLRLTPSATYFGSDDPDSLAASPTEWGLWATIEGRQVLVCGCADGTLRFQSGATDIPAGRLSSGSTATAISRSESRTAPDGRSIYLRTDGSGPALWGTQTEVDGAWLLAVGMGNGEVRVWSAPEWRDFAAPPVRRTSADIADSFFDPLWVFSDQPGGPARWGAWTTIAGRPTLACGYGNGAVVVRQVPVKRPPSGADDPTAPYIERLLRGHLAEVRWGAWNAGTDLLATGDDDGVVIVWRIQPNAPEPWEAVGRVEVGSAATCGAWIAETEDGRLLMVGTGRGEVEVYLSVGYDQLQRTSLFDNHPARQPGAASSQGGHLGPARWLATFDDRFPADGSSSPEEPRYWLACGFDDGLTVITRISHFTVGARSETSPMNPARFADSHMAVPASSAGPSTWGSWARINGLPVLATGYAGGVVQLQLFDRRLVVDLTTTRPQGNWGIWQLIDGKPTLTTGDAATGTVTVRRLEAELEHPRLPAYRTDNTTTVDQLDRTTEATALAELLTSASTSLPLAVGLFGEWGEGKSHFLGLLHDRVRDAMKQQWACHHVRQVRFNAWHYAETDLWSSLVTEMFGQLSRTEGIDPATAQRQMSRLETALVAAHHIDERIAAESERIAELEAEPSATPRWQMELLALRAAFSNALWERAIQQRDALDQRAGAATDEKWWQNARETAALCGKGNRVRWALTLILVIAGVVGLFFLSDLARGASTAAVVLAIAFLQRLHHMSKRYTDSVAELMRNVEVERARIASKRATALAVSRANLDALRREKHNLTAAGQLAGLVTDRAAEGGYRSSLGVMTRIREDFDKMSRLLLANDTESPRNARDSVGDEFPSIDRIVLYIDDLDRCPPQRVVQLLEAIHLLLAVELFVVVVAVDPRWMLRSIATHYREMLMGGPESDGLVVDPDDDGHWSSTPPQYLEKIFQVVFTLPPLATGGYLSMMNTLVGRRAEAPSTVVPVEQSTATTTPPPPSPTRRQESLPAPQRTTTVPDLGRLELTETIAPMTMGDNEITLLGLLGPPLINTPRSVKRLANSYGLFSAIERLRSDEGSDEARLPALVLLGALVAFPQLGPVLLTHLHTAAPTSTWTEFVEGLCPRSSTEHWANAADARLTATEAQAWRLLSDSLRDITARAGQAGIVLPESITAWQRWVQQVGRLSFPAGRVISGLSRHRT
ncbi:P-loop NTPase fold protein [Nocardia sp. NPDC056541]|uniref:P-loop NTPase fold protein n=1 Tax=Nocardia sp. NPDC056541 TaxID=3345860 RepID=UPI00366B3934